MNSLQKFYHWIAHSPSLFKPTLPFVTFESVPHTPLLNTELYTGNPRLGFLYQHLCTKFLNSSPRYQVVAEEIQLNEITGRTIGAVDLILKNLESSSMNTGKLLLNFIYSTKEFGMVLTRTIN